ncbi:MAG: DUF1501 domain-containing protein [Planctomycetes bacterium]|nr:DUF1501 domain-containing protein [Planctomycetota bacterium]
MPSFQQLEITTGRGQVTRRHFLRNITAGALATGTLNFRELCALGAGALQKQGMSLILLWMQGGPSQFETFDPKPGTATGGPTEAIETAVPGIRIAQWWERTAQQMQDIALIRSMTNKEGEHARATYQMHTGYLPTGALRHPSLGCSIAKELAPADHNLPAVVSIGPGGRNAAQFVGSGFLGVDVDPFIVDTPGSIPRNVGLATPSPRFERRLGLLGELENDFAARGGEVAVADHRQLYEKTRRLVQSSDVQTFEFRDESPQTKAQYGDSDFGRGCLLARRLVEAGVTFVEVRSTGPNGNWDTHRDNFTQVATNAKVVDPAFAALVADLKQRGLLSRTLVVWMGEFGRTPRINPNTGRDHYPRVFSAAVAGAGIRGGQVIGESTADGSAVKSDPVTAPDFFTTLCKALKVDSTKENLSPIGRPLKIVDGGNPVDKLLG